MTKMSKGDKGFTLIELLVVMSIIAILAVALAYSFQGWTGSYRIESQVKQMYADLMQARAMAMQRNRAFFADFPSSTSYRIREDMNGDNDPNVVAGDRILPTFPKRVINALTWGGGTIVFDIKGTMQPTASPLGATLCIFSSSPVNPDYDCIEISQTRINLGKLDNSGGPCNEANCVAR